jgi:hypothetical protein
MFHDPDTPYSVCAAFTRGSITPYSISIKKVAVSTMIEMINVVAEING